MAEFNKDYWWLLVTSDDLERKMEALQLARENASKLQTELLYWFAVNKSHRFRFEIFELLDDLTRENALTLIGDKGELATADKTNTFESFSKTDNMHLRQAIIHLERWLQKPSDKFKNSLVLEYKQRAGVSIEEAQKVVYSLFEEEPSQHSDD